MKNAFKKSLAVLLAFTMVFSSAYVGLSEFDFSRLFEVKAKAASESDFIFTLNADGETYSVSGCDTSLDGVLVIPDIYNGLPVTNIKDYAFDYYENLTSIVISDSITSIGSYAFYNCTNLLSIKIPDSVKSLGMSSFSGCTNLTSIEIGSCITSIGSMAFYNCSNLEKVYWNAKSVSDFHGSSYVFHNAGTSGTGIDFIFGDTVEKVPAYLFHSHNSSYYPKIISVNIGSNISDIDNDIFYNCVGLKAINVDNNNNSFSSVDGILFNKEKTKILSYPIGKIDYEYSIPDNVTIIGESSFYNCTKLNTIRIPEGITNIENDAFYNCTGLENVYWNAKNVVDFSSSSDVFYNAGIESSGIELVFGDTVETVPANLCRGDIFSSSNVNIKTVRISNNVTSIGASAFYNCKNLESVYITDITAWCNIDFDGYDSNPLYYANNLYINGVSATDIVIPDGVKRINDYAFYNCTNLESLTMADTVTNVGQSAFAGCTNLYSISLSDNLKLIYKSVFKDCTNLESVTIPNGVTSIDDYAFQNCSNLSSVTIPDSVTDIGCSAFENCSSLSSVTIPNSVTNISSYTFMNCVNLSFLKISDKLTSIGYCVFENCDGLTTVVIPNSVKSIGLNAFADCDNLTSITIPNSVTSINSSAFDDCSQQLVIKTSCSSYALEYANNNNINVEIIDSAHISSNWIIDTAATCTTDGLRHKECTKCGEVFETDVIKATGHNYSNWSIEKSATCDTAGKRVKICVDCGNTVYELIPAKGHNAGSWETVKKATVTGVGKKVKKCTECGEVLETAELPQLKCSKPKLKTISNTEYGVKITWGKVSGADRYRVYRKTSKGDWKYIGYTSKSYYTDKTAKSGTKYYYAIKARNEAGNSSLSGSLSKFYLADPTLSTPKSTRSGITLKWSKVSGAQGYIVYRKTGSGSYSKLATVKGSTKVTYTDKSAKKGKKYTYKVKAYYSKTYSAYSNTKTITDKY